MSTDSSAETLDHHPSHHFDSADQEVSASKLGIWLFLCTEILMFGGVFVAYIIYHQIYPETFHQGAHFLDWKLGAFNTLVLLLSSLTMALGIHYLQINQPKKSSMALLITLACGFVFMMVKYVEYAAKFKKGLLPGKFFSYENAADYAQNLALYFSFYFTMTGIHGLHVLIGMGLIFWVWLRTQRGEFGPKYYMPVEGVGLFWHLVDLIWIFLFPLLYLVG